MVYNPLVSIVVITYNSSKYVLETLDSIKLQTYQNIELIVSDDCSTDNTVELCTDWLVKNRGRFHKVELITSRINTGISANCNRGMKQCIGEWVMLIAGDDMYARDAALKFVEYINAYEQSEIVLSWCYRFTDTVSVKNIKELYIKGDNSKKQLLYMLKNEVDIGGCAMFVDNNLLKSLDYYDERFPYFEDFPFLIKCLSKGVYLPILEFPLKYYRENNDQSVSYHNPLLGNSINKFRKDVYNKLLMRNNLYLRYWHFYVDLWMCKYNSKYSLLGAVLRITDVYRWKKLWLRLKILY